MLITLCSFNLSASDFNLEILKAINEARLHPRLFLQKNGDIITKYNPKYVELLKVSKPILPVSWDIGLSNMAKSAVVENNLNPEYHGKNEICGFSSGGSRGIINDKVIQFLCDFYINIHDENYKYIGFYYSSPNNEFHFVWGSICDYKKITFTFDEKLDFSSVDFDMLNTGKNTHYMNKDEKTALQEINFVRAYPKIYAKVIAQYLAKESLEYNGLSNETYVAGLELIDELNKIEALPILRPAKCIFEAARLHGLDCQKRGFFSHTGSDNSAPFDRIRKQCPKFTSTGENGAGNASKNPRDHVISLLIDAGINNRGHRYNIQGKDWKVAGVSKYLDPKCVFGWVHNFAR